MKTEIKRRDFVTKCFKAGVTGCALLYGNSLLARDTANQGQKPDLKENNNEMKKKAFEEFKWKEKFNLDFDAEKVFCYGCKPKDKPLSINVNACTVRKCVTGKGYECCIECKELTACDKELWKNYPQFKEKVLAIQKTYFGT